MAVTRVRVDATTREKLGNDGLEEVCRCLWAIDCQTCGNPLGTEPPALWIDDIGEYILASLHHARCRSPGWRDGGPLVLVGGQLSWAARTVTVPVKTSDQQVHSWPMLLVNPGLEAVIAERDSDGRWRVTPRKVFRDVGLVPMRPPLTVDRPIEAAVARFTPTSIAVTLGFPFLETYEAPPDGPILDLVRALGGVLLGVTNAVHPDELTKETLFGAAMSGQLLTGWVRHDEASI